MEIFAISLHSKRSFIAAQCPKRFLLKPARSRKQSHANLSVNTLKPVDGRPEKIDILIFSDFFTVFLKLLLILVSVKYETVNKK